MRSVLPFPGHEDQDTLAEPGSVYIALSAPTLTPEDLHTLTPQVMLWDEGLYLLHLTPCLDYWRLEAQSKGEGLSQTLKRLLTHLSSTPHYHAAAASHAWPAILLALQMKEKGFGGLVSQDSPVGRRLLASISWEIWWQSCERYLVHAGKTNATASFLQQKRLMQKAMERLACHQPSQLKAMPASQIQRRFGSLIATLWELTFPPTQPKAWGTTIDSTFPWHSYPLCKSLSCKRHLEFPTQDWSVLEVFLRDDLNRLCLLDSFKKGERILNLEWRIVLYNLQSVLISTPFRHPHSLHHESPHQRTALLQISYAFQRTLRTLPSLDTAAPWIVSWELQVTQTLPSMPQSLSLFGDDRAEWEQLITLENQLDRKLQAYRICEDWIPEDSFATLDSQPQGNFEHLSTLEYMGRHRPLFLCRRSYPLNKHGKSQLWKFRERTMDKWWSQARHNSHRDYYQVLDAEHMLWVYRDAEGQCYVHGIYG